MNYTVLIAESSPEAAELLTLILDETGYGRILATSGEEAIKKTDDTVDIIILSLPMNDENGIHICRNLREKTNAPILIILGPCDDSVKSLLFSAGADDIVIKPFSYNELTARIKAHVRRYCLYMGKTTKILGGIISLKNITIDLRIKAVYKGDERLSLTATEYDIFSLMARERKKVFSSEEIYEAVWKEPYFSSADNTIMVHILKLRKKIEDDPKMPEVIKTAWGKGYYID